MILILGLSTAIAISNNHEITDNVTQVDVPYETETIVKGTVKTNDPVNYSFSPKYNSTVNASIPNKKKLSMCIEGSILDLTAFAQVNMLPIITEDSSAEYTDANLWTSVEIKNCKVEKVEITFDEPIVYMTVLSEAGDSSKNIPFSLYLEYFDCNDSGCNCTYFIGASVVYSIIIGSFGLVCLIACCSSCICCIGLLCVSRKK